MALSGCACLGASETCLVLITCYLCGKHVPIQDAHRNFWQAPAGMPQRGLRAHGIDLKTGPVPSQPRRSSVLPGSCEQRSKYLKLRSLLKSCRPEGLSHLAAEKLRAHAHDGHFLTVLRSPLPLPIPSTPSNCHWLGCFLLKEQTYRGQREVLLLLWVS